MGASGSKAAREGVRRFPARALGSTPPQSTSSATRRAARTARERVAARTSDTADDIDVLHANSIDPTSGQTTADAAFADRLRQMGVAQPNPTFSPSSTAGLFSDAMSSKPSSLGKPQFPPTSSNTTLSVLEARRQLQARAEQQFAEMGRLESEGREFLDVSTIRKILYLRQRGDTSADIESELRLKPGVVARLGALGVVSLV